MTQEPNHLDTKFRRKDVCDERHGGEEERCNARLLLCENVRTELKSDVMKNASDIKGINQKINATLIFAFLTTILILVEIAKSSIGW